MDKIPIRKVSKKIYKLKGFPSGPFSNCLNCKCGKDKKGGACCKHGVFVDKESYDLIIKHKKHFEKVLRIKIEKCFSKSFIKESDYLGKKAIGTKQRNHKCAFISNNGKGCEIVKYVYKNNLSHRMIPSPCRIYPLTWDNGKLYVGDIKEGCVCIDKNNKTKKSIYQTHKKEIKNIFCFE